MLNTLLISSGGPSAGRVKEDVKLFEAGVQGEYTLCAESLISVMRVRDFALQCDTVLLPYAYERVHKK